MKSIKKPKISTNTKCVKSDDAVLLPKWHGSPIPLDEREMLDKLRDDFDNQFRNIDEKRAAELAATTKSIISFVQMRIQEWTQYRLSSIQVSLGMLAFSIASLALISDPSKTKWYVYPVALPFLCGLLVTSFAHFIVVSRQISFYYPFIDMAKTWRWFYLYTSSKNIPFNTRLNKNEKSQSRRLYLEGLAKYAQNTTQLDSKSELKQDVEQLYLLLVYEGYIDQFAMSTNDLLRRGIIISVTLSVILGIISVIYHFI